jgi:predicted nicotinamide N-methyase
MPILCQFILSDEAQQLLADARVLELGAGVGVPGMLAGLVCRELVLTDWNPHVVDHLRAATNINAAALGGAFCTDRGGNNNNDNKHAYAGTNDLFCTSKSPIGTPSTAALGPF